MAILQLADYALYSGSIAHYLPSFLAGRSYSDVVIIVDDNTHAHCWPLLAPLLESYNAYVVEIPSGEIHKTLATCSIVWQEMMNQNLSRKALVINLGGGVIGDMGGFCAATYKRGVDFIQIPTTLLSQVDASVGGKLGVDFGGLKNSVGLFQNPQGVFLDARFFETLPMRELRSGLAEVIKHALIADVTQWETLIDNDWKQLPIEELAFHSVQIKQKIVEIDPFEQGLRKALNFGHTIGHAVESYFLETDSPLLHGEAIAIGMITESWLSVQNMGLSKEALMAITTYLIEVYGHQPIAKEIYPQLLATMYNDKKNDEKGINFSLLPKIGEVKVNNYIEEELILQSLDYYNQLK